MRKEFAFVVLSMLFLAMVIPYGCTNKKPESTDTLQVDSIQEDTTMLDSSESIIAETPMPKAADELFDDFFFNFAASRKLQQKRTTFPLPIYRDGKLESQVDRKQWKTERFFMRQEYYTLIIDSPKYRELGKDTSVNHVVIEKIQFDIKTVQEYFFDKLNGEWMLTSVHYQPLYKNRNASFLKFYDKFSTDSAFQVRSMAEEVNFTAPDPEDDFSTISGVIMPQQWPDFKPAIIPSGVIYNILYGERKHSSNRKIFLIRGISNGLEMEMDFKMIDGKWKLTKFNT
ncbi:DUF4348 domain-containing protein [Hallella bergensis]|uniref:DUF4348 domain-containing protein n=1 Tax=Hallella bergensis TaxID=242750 RepID=UPI0039905728